MALTCVEHVECFQSLRLCLRQLESTPVEWIACAEQMHSTSADVVNAARREGIDDPAVLREIALVLDEGAQALRAFEPFRCDPQIMGYAERIARRGQELLDRQRE